MCWSLTTEWESCVSKHGGLGLFKRNVKMLGVGAEALSSEAWMQCIVSKNIIMNKRLLTWQTENVGEVIEVTWQFRNLASLVWYEQEEKVRRPLLHPTATMTLSSLPAQQAFVDKSQERASAPSLSWLFTTGRQPGPSRTRPLTLLVRICRWLKSLPWMPCSPLLAWQFGDLSLETLFLLASLTPFSYGFLSTYLLALSLVSHLSAILEVRSLPSISKYSSHKCPHLLLLRPGSQYHHLGGDGSPILTPCPEPSPQLLY